MSKYFKYNSIEDSHWFVFIFTWWEVSKVIMLSNLNNQPISRIYAINQRLNIIQNLIWLIFSNIHCLISK